MVSKIPKSLLFTSTTYSDIAATDSFELMHMNLYIMLLIMELIEHNYRDQRVLYTYIYVVL